LKPAVLRPAAAAEVEETYGLYEARRDGYGDEYLSVFGDALEAIRRRPQSAPVVHADVRRELLMRFPQGLYYRVIDDQVVVVACLPARRSR
jgi:hypothetical protein